MSDLSIIVVSHGHEAMLPACINSMHEALDGLDREWVIIDNLATGTVRQVVQDLGVPATVHNNANPLGFAANVNQAVSMCRGEYLLLLNPDTWHHSGRVSDALTALRNNPDYGVIGFNLLNEDMTSQGNARPFPSLAFLAARGLGADHWPWQPRFYRDGLYRQMPKQDITSVDWVYGASMLFLKETFLAIGGMDANFRLYYEDVDFCLRCRYAGIGVALSNTVTLIHEHARGSARLPFGRLWRWHLASAIRYFLKHRYVVTPRLGFTR